VSTCQLYLPIELKREAGSLKKNRSLKLHTHTICRTPSEFPSYVIWSFVQHTNVSNSFRVRHALGPRAHLTLAEVLCSLLVSQESSIESVNQLPGGGESLAKNNLIHKVSIRRSITMETNPPCRSNLPPLSQPLTMSLESLLQEAFNEETQNYISTTIRQEPRQSSPATRFLPMSVATLRSVLGEAMAIIEDDEEVQP
jgi:hypothetical protein